MPFIEADFRTKTEKGELSFHTLCQKIKKGRKQSNNFSSQFKLGCRSQRIIGNQWRQLTESGVSKTDLIQWIIELSHFKKCTHRKALLEKTASLVQKQLCLENTFIVPIISNLRHIKKLPPDSIMESIVFHFTQNTRNNKWLKGNEISQCMLGVKNLPPSISLNTFLILIKFHIKELSDKEKWIDPPEIEYIFNGLSPFPMSKSLRELFIVLAAHITGNANKKQYLDHLAIEQVLACLQNKGENRGVKKVFLTLGPHIEADTKTQMLSLTPRGIAEDLLAKFQISEADPSIISIQQALASYPLLPQHDD